VNPIRPGFPPQVQTPQPQAGQAQGAQNRVQGGSAIFALARAQAAQQSAPAAPAATAPQPAAVNRVPKAQDDPPQKILRPGSLLDIRI
jgi:hypothetical protein